LLNADRQRWIDRVFGPPLCWLVLLLLRLRGSDAPPQEVQRVLIIVLSEMGAVVLTRPMFDRLRHNHPAATFYVLCSEQNRAALDLLDFVPADRVIAIRSGSMLALAGDTVRAVRRMRALRLDAVLDLELFARLSAILAGLSGARIRVGFDRFTQEGLYRGNLMNRPVLYNPYLHIAQQFVTLADAISSADVPTAKRIVAVAPLRLRPLALGPGELEAAGAALLRRHPAIAGRPLVFLCPGAGLLPIRAWPLESFSAVARDFVRRGHAVAVIGVAADRELARTIVDACDSEACIDLTGYTGTMRDVAVLLHLGELLITNDGGTGHVAAMTPIASIVLYGPETPALYGSLSPRAVNLHKGLSCSPCLTAYNHRRSPCDGNNLCLKWIAPEEVLAAADDLLGVSSRAAAHPPAGAGYRRLEQPTP
jgi:ADP-heptose:LPS heptosyltransferase